MIFAGYMFLNSIFNVKVVRVPNIIGYSEEDARKELESVGLVMDVAEERVFNKDVPEGHVVIQDPKPDTQNKVTNPVRVIISKGPKKVEVPNIVGKILMKLI